MKLEKTFCYRVDMHHYGDDSLSPFVGNQCEVTYHDVIIPCDVLDKVIEQEINSCDIIIKEKIFIYLPNEC